MENDTQTPRDVLNLALGLMGQPWVTFFDPEKDLQPETAAGKKTAAFYFSALREVEKVFSWQELIEVEDITSTSKDEWGRNVFSYENLSNDLLRPLGVCVASEITNPTPFTNPKPEDSNVEYVIHLNQIHTFAQSPIRLSYIRYEKDTTKLSPELFVAVYHRLAILACTSVTGDPNMMQTLLTIYQQLVRPTAELSQLSYKTDDMQNMSQLGGGTVRVPEPEGNR